MQVPVKGQVITGILLFTRAAVAATDMYTDGDIVARSQMLNAGFDISGVVRYELEEGFVAGAEEIKQRLLLLEIRLQSFLE